MAKSEQVRTVTATQVVALTIPFVCSFMTSHAILGYARTVLDWAALLSLVGVVISAMSFSRGVRYVALLTLAGNLVGLLWYAWQEAFRFTY